MLWNNILNIAIHTPSPHNVQPWKVKIHDERNASLFVDQTRLILAADTTGSFVLTCLSMFTESLRLLAANRKHRLEVRYVFNGFNDNLTPFANLTLVPDETIKSPYEDFLFTKRRTSRISYIQKSLPDDVMEDFKALFKFTEHNLDYTSNKNTIEELLSLNIDALFHDLNEKDYYKELLEYLRFSEKQSNMHRDGLDYRCMNMTGYEMHALTKCPAMLETPIIKTLIKSYYRQKIGHAEAIGWISGPYWEPESAIAIGPALFRFWLETAKRDIYFMPFGNLVTNKTAHAEMNRITQTDDIWFIFKLGYSLPPSKSLRRPLEEVMTHD